MANRVRRSLGVLLLVWLIPLGATAAAECSPWAARIVSVQGEIEVKRANTSIWQPVNRNDTFCAGDSIRIGDHSRAAITLANETLLRLDQNSAIKLTQFEPERPSILEFIMGIGHFISRVPRSLKIETATVNAAIEGTEFVVTVSANETSVTVFEGAVLTQNQQGEMRITDGETVIAKANAAPVKKLLAKPRDIVQWALYFPPIIEVEKPNELSTASQLLYVGRVKEALTLLQGIDSGEALALRAIIAIVNNENDRAFKLATDAIQQAPMSATTHIAMSYAWQAKLDLKQALASAQQAVKQEPNNTIAWARLAELQLSFGELDEALHSAQQAIQLNANLSRTQSILGYAYLARIDIDEAIAAFNIAIELDQVDPLPHLGLGLAKIRKNNLKQGRREIEIAASLDPNNAIIRSYLGKAYYEEKRGPLDAVQFAMSKQLDPNDPTPYYYDAIRKQTENDPIGALEDLNKSIELNDNRAVYRSSLQLDQDEAARNASLARIYQNLSFEQQALLNGWESVNTDPTNFSAHRFLADSYQALPRHDIARVSEILQSQLFQPLNINPIQPQLAESNLGILDGTGPSALSFNEYNPLFTRNGLNAQLNLLGGNDATAGNDLMVSGLYDWVSFSFGQFHYETDGFRENNDLSHDIYDFFIQARISQELSIQAEYRDKETKAGDVLLQFAPSVFEPNSRKTIESESSRFGFNYQPIVGHTILGSFIDRIDNELQTDYEIDILLGARADKEIISDIESRTYELQYLFSLDNSSMIFGAGSTDENSREIYTLWATLLPPDPPTEFPITDDDDTFEIEHENHYIYAYFDLIKNINIVVGASHDSYNKQGVFKVDQTSPKLGAIIKVNPSMTFRLAAFEIFKRPLVSDQTIEPTQVAGFNQFFDDINASKSTRIGAALDHRFSKSLNGGLELTKRDIDKPVVNTATSTAKFDDLKEQYHRAYLYWILDKRFTLSTELFYELFENPGNNLSHTALKLKTYRLPVNITYHDALGFSGNLIASYVDHEYIDSLNDVNKDDFWIVDASLSYRLPKRSGMLSIGANNLFNRSFNFYDLQYTSEPQVPIYQMERTVFVRYTLTF